MPFTLALKIQIQHLLKLNNINPVEQNSASKFKYNIC